MIDVKDMARKATSGCSHSQPIIVPCVSCVESSMRQWEEAVRHDTRQALREEVRQMKENMEKAESAYKALTGTVDRLKAVVSGLERTNEDLRKQLKAAKDDAAEARIQLHAEQTSRTFLTTRVVSE